MRLAFPLLLLVIFAVGCASRRNVDLLEARLRDRDDQVQSLTAQLQREQSELSAARRLNESLKQKLVRPVSHDASLDFDEQHFRVAGLKINALLTGGFDRDGKPGDDQVTLVFAPVDDRGQPIKLPGQVECELHDPAQPAGQQRLGLWTFDLKTTRTAWRSSLGSWGYRFELPWQTPPRTSELEVRVRLRSANGNQFETSSPIRIVLAKSPLGADEPMP
ncbi:MAG: hypothetical protein ACKV2Q_03060 [Planctomycetaceae bacterium]